MRRAVAATLAALLATAGCALSPERAVLPYPAHVKAGVAVGDTITVRMRDGTAHRITVESIGNESLASDGVDVAYDDIVAIGKRSTRPITNPCDDGTPVGCSVPAVLTLTSEFHDRYSRRFEDACIAHDYCYRHGFRTYGDSRADCDAVFLHDMQMECGDVLDLDPVSRAECLLAASEFHIAVRRSGSSRFLTDAGSYCEYRGPPTPPKLRETVTDN